MEGVEQELTRRLGPLEGIRPTWNKLSWIRGGCASHPLHRVYVHVSSVTSSVSCVNGRPLNLSLSLRACFIMEPLSALNDMFSQGCHTTPTQREGASALKTARAPIARTHAGAGGGGGGGARGGP